MNFISLQVELDECTFLSGSSACERGFFSYPGFVDDFLNNRDEGIQIGLVVIKVTKKIGGRAYNFISQPCSDTVDNLRIRIEILKTIVIHYNSQNPNEYYFEFR